jgi:hypothetical protein
MSCIGIKVHSFRKFTVYCIMHKLHNTVHSTPFICCYKSACCWCCPYWRCFASHCQWCWVQTTCARTRGCGSFVCVRAHEPRYKPHSLPSLWLVWLRLLSVHQREARKPLKDGDTCSSVGTLAVSTWSGRMMQRFN